MMQTFTEFIADRVPVVANEAVSTKIKWAKTKTHAEEPWHYDREHAVVTLDVEKVIKDSDPDYMPRVPFTDNRMEMLSSHIADGGWLDPPVISYNDLAKNPNGNYQIDFTNGRHRTWWSLQHGIRKIPFIVMKSQKEYFLERYM